MSILDGLGPDNPFARLLSPEVAMPMAAALMGNGGNMQNIGNAFGAGGQAFAQIGQEKKLKAQTNKTKQFFLDKGLTDYADAMDMGLSSAEAYKAYLADQRELKAQTPEKPNIINAGDGRLYNSDTSEWITAPDAGPQDAYAERQQAAARYGLAPDNPAYESFILTGKMPREDAQPLTATDKKAVLEADEMVAANENAIAALDKASSLSDSANSGWFAGTRAAIGNNLPDMVVPDFVSSPESSIATTDMDNAVIGQALTSLKTIFGGAPTEGERKILLELQGSSSMPAPVRKRVFERARELAERRLEFNRQRADALRGGTFYRPGGEAGPQAPGEPMADPLGIR